jgi:hypothetical protein
VPVYPEGVAQHSQKTKWKEEIRKQLALFSP